MVDKAISMLARRLDGYLRDKTDRTSALVAYASPGSVGQKPDPNGDGRLALAIVEIEPAAQGRGADVLFVLSAHRLTAIPDALGLLSHAMDWQQAHASMSPATEPEMPPGIARITLDPADIPRSEQMAIRQAGGLGLAPVLFWQVRILAADDGIIFETRPAAASD